jgi:hypothetical protein
MVLVLVLVLPFWTSGTHTCAIRVYILASSTVPVLPRELPVVQLALSSQQSQHSQQSVSRLIIIISTQHSTVGLVTVVTVWAANDNPTRVVVLVVVLVQCTSTSTKKNSKKAV